MISSICDISSVGSTIHLLHSKTICGCFKHFFSHAEWPIWMITWGRRVLEDTHPDAPNRQTLAAGVEFIFHLTGLASLPQ